MSKRSVRIKTLAWIAVLTSLGVSCSLPFTETLETATSDQLAGVVQLQGRMNSSALSVSSTISIQFTRPLDAGSIAITGDLGSHAAVSVRDGDASGVNAIELTPSEDGWPIGSDLSVRIAGSVGSIQIVPAELTFTVVEDTLHVSAARGRYAGVGTTARPFNTLQRALEFVAAEFPGGASVEVRIAEGEYGLATDGLADEMGVQIPDGMIVRGGYKDDFSAREPAVFSTALVSRMSYESPAVTLGSADLDGLTIRDEGYVSSTLILVEGSSTITDVEIYGRYGSAVEVTAMGAATIESSTISSRSIAGVLAVDGGELRIVGSVIEALAAGGDVVGIDARNATVGITGSTLTSEFASAAFLLLCNGGELLVEDSALGLGGGTLAAAIYVDQTTVTIRRSRLWSEPGANSIILNTDRSNIMLENTVIDAGDQDAVARGISVTDGSLTVRNSTIGVPTGSENTPVSVRSSDNAAVPTLIENSILFMTGSDGGYFIGTDSPDTTTISHTNTYGPGRDFDVASFARGDAETPLDPDLVNAIGVISDNPLLADPGRLADGGDWNLTAGSPLSVADGGLNGLSEAWGFSVDVTGLARTDPWSMGAYEYD